MNVSKDGLYLAILDSANVGAVFKASPNMSGVRPVAFHDFGGPPTVFSVLSGP